MKKLLLLLVSTMLSFNAHGEWTITFEWDNGDIAYIDLDTIKESDGYIYWWELKNITIEGNKSLMVYQQGDCGVARTKLLSISTYKELMGEGDSTTWTSDKWGYVAPGTHTHAMLALVCDFVKRDLEALDYSVLY